MHRNARLTYWGRQELVRRIKSGIPIAHVAPMMHVSRATATKWWKRHLDDPDGEWWLDVSSRPHHCPTQTAPIVEARIVRLRRKEKLGPLRIAGRLGMPASTVHRVLVRQGCNRLGYMDRPTGRVIRRYEHDQPGDLVHIDIKKLGKIPTGGGWRAHGRGKAGRRRKVGYCYIHSIVDDHSRLAYSEPLNNEQATTTVAFFRRARVWFARHGINITAVLSDNGPCYKSKLFNDELASAGIKHRYTRPYRPQTNGKVERFNRTLADEWAYARVYTSNSQRARALDRFLHTYNHHRGHTALGGDPPISATNLAEQHN